MLSTPGSQKSARRFAAFLRELAGASPDRLLLEVPTDGDSAGHVPHHHSFWEINLLRDGASPARLRLTPPERLHEWGNRGNQRIDFTIWLCGRKLSCTAHLPEVGDFSFIGYFPAASGEVDRTVDLLRVTAKYADGRPTPEFAAALRSALLLATAELFESPRFDSLQSQSNSECVAWSFIADNFTDPGLNLSEIAGRAACSTQQLARRFRRRYGESVWSHLIRLRLEYSEKLLRDPARDIADIVLLAGWRDRNYFTRAFRTAYGLPPGKYRAQFLARAPETPSAGRQRPKYSR